MPEHGWYYLFHISYEAIANSDITLSAFPIHKVALEFVEPTSMSRDLTAVANGPAANRPLQAYLGAFTLVECTAQGWYRVDKLVMLRLQ